MKKVLLMVVALLLLGGCSFKVGKNTVLILDNGSKPSTEEANKVLDLSGKNLTKVDVSIFDQTNLEELNLSSNNLIDALPSQIGKLKDLKILNVSNNQMTGVPAEIGQLINLEVLDLSNNQLTGLPNELANLKNLKTLNLSGNEYSEKDFESIRNSLPNVDYILE
ncbi:MAG: leucine-rich repeat domain-containing protein [Patescibacteria group bacterium]|jgi:Leucine-rich repeat (LRR) protein